MSLTLAGALLGFAGSAVPEVLDYFKGRQERKKDIEVLKIQADLLEKRTDLDLKKFNEMATDNEHERLLAHDAGLSQDAGFFGGLRKSVRPVITYAFFGLFIFVKVSILNEAMNADGIQYLQAVQVVWDDETQGLFAGIMSFWFGRRAIEKTKQIVGKGP